MIGRRPTHPPNQNQQLPVPVPPPQDPPGNNKNSTTTTPAPAPAGHKLHLTVGDELAMVGGGAVGLWGAGLVGSGVVHGRKGMEGYAGGTMEVAGSVLDGITKSFWYKR